ncbi:TetR-like C-terminal domain-containing protein [Amycolatopsis acidicola]|uniref:TetR-like C-terminal domain-containing protein n=1 Tax=Amycolatopsis acidicola TaxID=2596893 RepID=UPI0014087418|nr:TetR-like C-terminal domain-containing protein [Amycolatopsis acidicola]
MRENVHLATMDIVWSQGIDALSVAAVAEKSGVHETTIYRRWGTPAGLVVDYVTSETHQAFPVPDNGNLHADLVELLGEIVEFVEQPLGRLVLQLSARRDQPGYEEVREQFRVDRFEAGMKVFEHAAQRGELRPGLDRNLALETLIGPLYVRLLLTDGEVGAELVPEVVDLVLPGMLA